MQPELIADYACHTGEGPLWHPDEQCVYWTDIPAGRLFRYYPASGQHEQCFDEGVVGGFTLQEDGALLLFMDRGAVRIWRDGELTTVIDSIPGEEDSRFNDVIADPEGRVFCGTMSSPSHKGRLYRLDPDGSLHQLLEGIGTSNGMGFTPDGQGMYYIDSPEKEVYRFDYDRSTGAISNQTVFVKTPPDEGSPDGMTVDAEGYVWVAKWDGGCVVRYTPEGEEERRLQFPAKKVSCLTFGGADYADIYVTTAGGHIKATDGEHAGALFRVNVGIRGVPEFRSRIAP